MRVGWLGAAGVVACGRMRAWMEVFSSAEIGTRVPQRRVVEAAGVEVEHPGRIGAEVGVAGEDPGAVLPGLDRIGGQPAPDGGARDRGGESQIVALPAS